MLAQASGEALYTLDHPLTKEGLWAAYVASEHSLARIEAVDTARALQLPGVVAYISGEDIPKGGVNRCLTQEPVFAEGVVQYLGEPIGLIVAETRAAAEQGAQLVEVGLLTTWLPCASAVAMHSGGVPFGVRDFDEAMNNGDGGGFFMMVVSAWLIGASPPPPRVS